MTRRAWTMGSLGLVLVASCTNHVHLAQVTPTGRALPAVASPGAVAAGNILVSSNSASVVANNAGSLTGTVSGPASGLVANNAAGLLSNNASTLISNNAGGWRVLADAASTTPIAGAQVMVVDAQGNALSATTSTDAQGHYSLSDLKASGDLVFVRATYHDNRRTLSLLFAAAAPHQATSVPANLDPASTLAAKKVVEMARFGQLDLAKVSAGAIATLAQQLAPTLQAVDLVAAVLLDDHDASRAFDRVLAANPALKASAAAAGNGLVVTTPEGPAPSPTPTPTPAHSATTGPTAAPTATAGATTSPGATVTQAPTAAPTGSATSTPTPGATATTTPTPDATATPTASPSAAGLVVSTYAGGASGFRDGAPAGAKFNQPANLAINAAGTLFVADNLNQRLRTVDPGTLGAAVGGTVKTLAGSGSTGSNNGTGAAAQFDHPWGAVLALDGNLYVSDTEGQRIRQVNPVTGLVAYLAGGSTSGSNDGTGTSAHFKAPAGLAIDASGLIYVADSDNNAIRTVTTAGVVKTLIKVPSGFSDGTSATAKMDTPMGLAVDGAGNVYIADQHNHAIRVLTPGGVLSTLAGNGDTGFKDGTGSAASFNEPIAIALGPDGNLYVADKENRAIRKVTPGGVVTTLTGSGPGTAAYVDGPAATARFGDLKGITVDSHGRIFVSDGDANAIRLIQ